METMPSALVKDLLSTGYFYAELRSYNISKEIDLATYVRNYTIPFLAKTLDGYRRSGQVDKYDIFNLAIKCLADVHDDALGESILGLKKITAEEIDSNEKVLHRVNQDDTSRRVCHRKSQSAQILAKLLVSIIKMFKLPENLTKRKTQQAVDETVKDLQEPTVLAS
jgi:hypothetical protein